MENGVGDEWPRRAERAFGEEAERLIERARAGSPEALGALFGQARRPLIRAASRELPRGLQSKEGLSDIVQETFLVAHRRFDQFQGRTAGELALWLKAILRNTSLHLRRGFRARRREQSREVRLDDMTFQGDEPSDSAASPSSLADRHETEAILGAAVDRLPARDQEILRWRHRDDLTFEEIGRRLAISTAGARGAWIRALQRLRDELG